MARIDASAHIEPLIASLIAVPAAQRGVCRICHSTTKAGYDTCLACQHAKQVLGPLTAILPISLTTPTSPLHQALRDYKDAASPDVRTASIMRAASLLAVFLRTHQHCIGDYDVITTIPSPNGRTAPRALIQPIIGIRDAFRDVLRPAPGYTTRDCSAQRYVVNADVSGQRVLVVDDTFTTGATMFSAVSALNTAGATVVGPVVIGRFVRSNWAPSNELLGALQTHPWKPERCVRCHPIQLRHRAGRR